MSVIDNHTLNNTPEFVPPVIETVTDCLQRGRERARSSKTMSQTECVDLLLDCRNAAVRSTVREVTTDALVEIAHVSLVRSSDFTELLDLVHLALAVDAAFDHLDLAA